MWDNALKRARWPFTEPTKCEDTDNTDAVSLEVNTLHPLLGKA